MSSTFTPTPIAAPRANGATLRDWLKRSFRQFNQIEDSSPDAELLAADFPSFNSDTVEGLTWSVDPVQPGPSVLFDRGPAAAGHLQDLAPLLAEPIGLTPKGFRRFRLHP